MADLQPNDSRCPFQEVPRNFIHVHELDPLIKQAKHVLRALEILKESSLRSKRNTFLPKKYRSLIPD